MGELYSLPEVHVIVVEKKNPTLSEQTAAAAQRAVISAFVGGSVTRNDDEKTWMLLSTMIDAQPPTSLACFFPATSFVVRNYAPKRKSTDDATLTHLEGLLGLAALREGTVSLIAPPHGRTLFIIAMCHPPDHTAGNEKLYQKYLTD